MPQSLLPFSDSLKKHLIIRCKAWRGCGNAACLSIFHFLLYRSRMLRRGWIFQVIWDIHVSVLLSLTDGPQVPLGLHLPPRSSPFAPVPAPPPSPAPSSDHPRGEERRASSCKYAWMEVSVASRPAELLDLWPGDLCGSWDHIRAPAAAGGWSGGALHDHGAR